MSFVCMLKVELRHLFLFVSNFFFGRQLQTMNIIVIFHLNLIVQCNVLVHVIIYDKRFVLYIESASPLQNWTQKMYAKKFKQKSNKELNALCIITLWRCCISFLVISQSVKHSYFVACNLWRMHVACRICVEL